MDRVRVGPAGQRQHLRDGGAVGGALLVVIRLQVVVEVGQAEVGLRQVGRIARRPLQVDVEGHLYVSAPPGVWIFDASGRHLGTIAAATPIHNFAWGGPDGRTLYLCARANLYRIPLLVEGIRP